MHRQSVLFLQGPLGPFFRELAREFSAHGYITHKINFNGGDRFYSGADHCCDFVGSARHWPDFLQKYLIQHQIQSVFLMGDCRLYHWLAKPVCQRLGVQFMVFEEGYLRPDTITLEQDGVNAFSSLDCSLMALALTSRRWPKAEVHMPPSMPIRIVYASTYYWAGWFQRRRFRQYQHHRDFSPVAEGAKWLRGFARKRINKKRDLRLEQRLTGELSGRFFLVPLQVHNDSQLLYHSDYASVTAFIEDVVVSFADCAKPTDYLLFKHHPMDRGHTDYQQVIMQLAEGYGVGGRILYCHDIPLPALYRHALGVVTVNSTVGLSALLHRLPVKVMGRAFYDIRNLTSQCSLDQFWTAPEPVHSALFNRLHALIFHESQINGSFFSELPLTCRNTRLFYERKFAPGSFVYTSAVAELLHTITRIDRLDV